MRKARAFILCLALIGLASAAWAQVPTVESPLRVEGRAGLGYDNYPVVAGPFSFLGYIFNLRGTYGVDVMAKLGSGFCAGGDFGAGLMYVEVNSQPAIVVADIPVRAKLEFDFAPGFGIALSGGILWAVCIDAAFHSALFADFAATLRLGGFYLEGSYAVPLAASYYNPQDTATPSSGALFRFGAGFSFGL